MNPAASSWTQIKAMYWLRTRLFRANFLSTAVLVFYPIAFLFMFVSTFGVRRGAQVEAPKAPEPMPFAALVTRPPSFIAGGTAAPAALDAVFSRVNATVAQHRIRYEGRQSLEMIPTFWHRANTPADVGTLSKQLANSNPTRDIFAADITSPFGGYIVHSAPSINLNRSKPLNASIVVNTRERFQSAGVPSVMLNALHNAIQDSMSVDRNTRLRSSSNSSASVSVLDRVFSMVESVGSDAVVAPWLLRVNGTQAGFRVHRTERISTILFEPSAAILAMSFMLPPITWAMTSERLDGHFFYVLTNGLPPFTYYLGAMVGYSTLVLGVAVSVSFILLGLTWFWAVPGFILVLLYCLTILVQAAALSLFFSSRFTVFPTLSLYVAAGSFGPTFVLPNNMLPAGWNTALTLLLPPFAVTRSMLDMVQTVMNFEPYRALSSESMFLPTVGVLVAHIIVGLAIVYVFANRAARDHSGVNPSFSLLTIFAWILNWPRRLCYSKDCDGEAAHDLAATTAALPTDPLLQAEIERIRSGGDSVDDVIRIDRLGVSFPNRRDLRAAPQQVVRDLTFTVRRHESFAFLGPNGAGKSTTVNVLTGALKATSGSVTVCGKPPGDPSTHRLLSACPQYDHAFPQLSVYEHMRTFAVIKGVPLDDVEEAIEKAVFDAMLEPYLYRRVQELSGGTRRRMTIALACLGDPAIVILDEPTMGVDIASRRAIWEVISNLKQRSSILLVTHDMDEAERLCERAGVMINGSLVCLGAPQRLKSLFGTTYRLKLQLVHADKIQVACAAVETSLVAFGGKLLNFVQQNAKGLEFFIEVTNEGLPTRFLADMLRFVNGNRVRWGVSDFALGEVTLSELFVRLAPHHHAYQEEEAIAL
ncbi:hypothetical protein BCR44DRAFT_60321 [Catenaria anguillulae PL171]|uniref:ABC transporter domain-containing protein n=1 Tax=Catenaria anguillulae PL171 TaxID=765915 RepID=A0A1Y2I536_9FUNG|nr:hypothetical protein BCR44DRAFT_60321 [Catenaria anguillulae PL171]